MWCLSIPYSLTKHTRKRRFWRQREQLSYPVIGPDWEAPISGHFHLDLQHTVHSERQGHEVLGVGTDVLEGQLVKLGNRVPGRVYHVLGGNVGGVVVLVGKHERVVSEQQLRIMFAYCSGNCGTCSTLTHSGPGCRAPSQYKDRLIYVWRFPC